jgi:lysyl-tRNA synthetase class 2
MGIVSTLTPEAASRSRLVQAVLPPGWPTAARTLTLACGLALLWIARGLARRKRRAWQLAVALVVACAVAHLVKGLEVGEAIGSLVVVGLLFARREFVAPGDPESVRPLLQIALALCAIVPLVVLHQEGTVALSDRFDDALLLLIGALAARALFVWLSPIAERTRHIPADRRRAAELVQTHGRDSLAYFSLRHDKSIFLSASRRSFLAYRVVAGTAIITGDPIGEASERGELVEEFRRVARAKAWRVVIAGASAEALRDYARLGFRSIYLGDEAFVRPERFSLEGRPIRKVRQSVSRLSKAGYRVEIVAPHEIGSERRAELRAVSEQWRGRWPERGFTMAMDALFAYPDTVLALAIAPGGEVEGFLQLVPSPACGGYSLAAMRRRRGSANGLMEFAIVATIEWARARGVREVSLNFSVFAEYLRAEGTVLRTLLLKTDRLFQLERLHSFNRKFFPEWRRRYFCFERWTELPLAALAFLHAESLLTPPGPWTARQRDIAAR